MTTAHTPGLMAALPEQSVKTTHEGRTTSSTSVRLVIGGKAAGAMEYFSSAARWHGVDSEAETVANAQRAAAAWNACDGLTTEQLAGISVAKLLAERDALAAQLAESEKVIQGLSISMVESMGGCIDPLLEGATAAPSGVPA